MLGQMTKRQFRPILIFFLFLCSCSNDNSLSNKPLDVPTINNLLDSINYSNRSKYFGISLINGKNGGIGFTDSITGMTKQFRTIKILIVNDTIVPVGLQINLSKKPYAFFYSLDTKFNAFLLPDTVIGFGSELNAFLNNGIQKPSVLKKVIQPGQTCVLNIGMLFFNSIGRPDGYTSEEVFFKGQKNNLGLSDTISPLKTKQSKTLDIILGITLHSQSTYNSTVSCGQILFSH
jgi:hypothetical protein